MNRDREAHDARTPSAASEVSHTAQPNVPEGISASPEGAEAAPAQAEDFCGVRQMVDHRETSLGTRYSIAKWTCPNCGKACSCLYIDDEWCHGDSLCLSFGPEKEPDGTWKRHPKCQSCWLQEAAPAQQPGDALTKAKAALEYVLPMCEEDWGDRPYRTNGGLGIEMMRDALAALSQPAAPAAEPAAWIATGHLREVMNGNAMNAYMAPERDRFADVPLYIASPPSPTGSAPLTDNAIDALVSQAHGYLSSLLSVAADGHGRSTLEAVARALSGSIEALASAARVQRAELSDEDIRKIGGEAFGIDIAFDGHLMKFARAVLQAAGAADER